MKLTKQIPEENGARQETPQMDLINVWSKKPLTEEEVYTFAIRLCDNEIDRDGERFSADALDKLAALFMGKSGIFDHQWSAHGQTARIYRTEVVCEADKVTAAGDTYRYLKGWAYMLRSPENAPLIAEIEGGIKREVSVGCAMGRAVCSICGDDSGACGHVRGKRYDGKLCWGELCDATDAYEWSFVAVPAQRKAGVMKGARGGARVDAERLAQLEFEAAMGRRYLASLRGEVARLMSVAQPELPHALCKGIAHKLGEEELLVMEGVYRRRAEGRLSPAVQLPHPTEGDFDHARDTAFLV